MNNLQKAFQFQGHKNKKKYFEGWYYKLVSSDELTTLAFIPGISLNEKDSHSFIQVFLYENNENEKNILQTYYLTFDVDDFQYDKEKVQVNLGENVFSLDTLLMSYNQVDLVIDGNISLSNLSPIQTSFTSPTIMGPFQYAPLMECYHSVVSMSHDLQGTIIINGKVFDFSNGKGYIEKDYGKSFPSEYIWIQSNSFSNEKTSIMFSYATIPFIGLHFKGLIANLVYDNKEYRFATYNFSKCRVQQISDNEVKVVLKKGKIKLFISAVSSHFKELASPENGEMKNTIKEGLSGEVQLALYERDKLIYEDIGKCSGIEIMMKR